MLLLGLSGHMPNGFIDRMNPEDRYLASISPSEQGVYVRRRFDALLHAPFSESQNNIKVVVIGDSYAKDLVNAIFESPLAKKIQISTHSISAGCGNLFLERNIDKQITSSYPVLCHKDDWYNSQKIHELIRQSDQVWLASNWQAWEVDLLPESLSNLRREFGDKFVIFGTKDFGAINIRKLLATSVPLRYQTENQIPETNRQINHQLTQIVEAGQFVNVSELMCGSSKGECRIFTPDGRLLSYDGGHLTADGAKILGSKLVDAPVIKNALPF